MFDLDGAVRAALEQEREKNEAAQRMDDREFEARKAHATTQVLRLLSESIPIVLQEQLEMHAVYTQTGGLQAVIRFTLDGADWELGPVVGSSNSWCWVIRPPLIRDVQVSQKDLLPQLLVNIGHVREAVLEHTRRESLITRQQEAAEAALAAKQFERLAEHARCMAKIDAAIEAGKAAAWRWPEGKEITMYRWSWCIAGPTQDSGADWEVGWSIADRLDANGYAPIAVPPHGPRQIRLDMGTHLPVVSHYTFTGMDDIAPQLTELWSVKVMGVEWREYDTETLRETETGYIHRTVGRHPVKWVRDLIDGER